MFGSGVAGGNYGGALPSLPQTLIFKQTNEGRHSGILAVDPTMIIPFEGNSLYRIETFLAFKMNLKGWRYQFTLPAAVNTNWVVGEGEWTGLAALGNQVQQGSALSNVWVEQKSGIFTTTADGEIGFSWNTNSAGASAADDTILLAGSHIIITKLN